MKRREFIAGTVTCAVVGPVAAQNPMFSTNHWLERIQAGTPKGFTEMRSHSEVITIDQMRDGLRTDDFYGEPWNASHYDASRRRPGLCYRLAPEIPDSYPEVDAWWTARLAEMGRV